MFRPLYAGDWLLPHCERELGEKLNETSISVFYITFISGCIHRGERTTSSPVWSGPSALPSRQKPRGSGGGWVTWKKAYYTSISEQWHSGLLSHGDYTQWAGYRLTLGSYHFLCNNKVMNSQSDTSECETVNQSRKADIWGQHFSIIS